MAKWYEDSGFQSDIVLSTRVRLARNISGIPFPAKMTMEDAKRVIDMTDSALSDINLGFSRTDISSIGTSEAQKLVEKRYISPNLAASKKPAAVFVSGDESLSIMVGEEDHLRMQAIFAGFECKKAYDIISGLDTFLADRLSYAVHRKYGYLTSCLTNAGTGMRISCMMHLPAICKSQLADSLFAALGKLGVTVRGMYGEGSKASGYLFQISNQTTLGISEKEIADRVSDVVNQLIAKERELRQKLHNPDDPVLEDKIMRSYGILKSARILSTKELLELSSYVRFGISLGLISDIEPRVISTLMVETGPAHLSEMADPRERDIKRAQIVRGKLDGGN
ncbi:MAG: protein arginine kinase [Clostridia bacterium]|nr:protein arginine kinase [Clostridia bacterium]